VSKLDVLIIPADGSPIRVRYVQRPTWRNEVDAFVAKAGFTEEGVYDPDVRLMVDSEAASYGARNDRAMDYAFGSSTAAHIRGIDRNVPPFGLYGDVALIGWDREDPSERLPERIYSLFEVPLPGRGLSL
jgi:hypothetical protein